MYKDPKDKKSKTVSVSYDAQCKALPNHNLGCAVRNLKINGKPEKSVNSTFEVAVQGKTLYASINGKEIKGAYDGVSKITWEATKEEKDFTWTRSGKCSDIVHQLGI